MQEKITAHFPSPDLRKKISETSYVFSKRDELLLILKYVTPVSARISFLHEYAKSAPSTLAKTACDYAKYYEDSLSKFMQSENGCVYELCIKETPDTEAEPYLCASFESALHVIGLYYDEYADADAHESECSRYIIKKKRILYGSESKLSDGTMGEMMLGQNQNILDVSIENKKLPTCAGDTCTDCKNICLYDDVTFPQFLKTNETVIYTDYYGKEHIGVSLDRDDVPETQLTYIIPLDSPQVREKDFDEFLDHEHIAPPYVSRYPVEKLTAKELEVYNALVEYLKSREDNEYS